MKPVTVQIRRSVFETNSSSSHSLVIEPNKSGLKASFPKDMLQDGLIDVTLDGYGWEWVRYRDPLLKLNYMATALVVSQKRHKLESLLERIANETDCEVRVNGIKYRSYLDRDDIPGEFYIDHLSNGMGNEIAELGLDGMMDFIFNPRSYIETGNDNSERPFRIRVDHGDRLDETIHVASKEEVQAGGAIPIEVIWRNETGRRTGNAFADVSGNLSPDAVLEVIRSGGYIEKLRCRFGKFKMWFRSDNGDADAHAQKQLMEFLSDLSWDGTEEGIDANFGVIKDFSVSADNRPADDLEDYGSEYRFTIWANPAPQTDLAPSL